MRNGPQFPDTLSTCGCSDRDTNAGPQQCVFSPHSVHGRIRNENLPKRLRSNIVCLSSEFLALHPKSLRKDAKSESGTEQFLGGAVWFPEPNDFQFQLSKYFSAAQQLCSDPLFKVIRLVLPSRSMFSCLPPALLASATYTLKVRMFTFYFCKLLHLIFMLSRRVRIPVERLPRTSVRLYACSNSRTADWSQRNSIPQPIEELWNHFRLG